ncbi:MAG: hypothetical protein HYY24_21320 [Verrucomicrobia bacterium]|nr:hypothetical protein [Verrucomicrobiota bacterium]
MNRSHRRQVLDRGDGVLGVTALALAVIEISKLADAPAASPTESGDSADSVAARIINARGS